MEAILAILGMFFCYHWGYYRADNQHLQDKIDDMERDIRDLEDELYQKDTQNV